MSVSLKQKVRYLEYVICALNVLNSVVLMKDEPLNIIIEIAMPFLFTQAV